MHNFYLRINLSTVRPSGFVKSIRWDDLQLRSDRSRSQNAGQGVGCAQPGLGLSSRLGAPCGTIWTATSFASMPVSLTTLCMSPQPRSVKLWPALYVVNVQLSLLTVIAACISVIIMGHGWL